ncbi:F-box domain containing protein [Tanacetum coccineum]
MPCSYDRRGMWDRRENVIVSLVVKWLDKPKPKKSKGVFIMNLYHNGIFAPSPVRYLQAPQFSDSSDDEYSSVDGEDLENIDFYTTDEEDVIIKHLSTHDDFLNRLCSTGGLFRAGVPKPGSSSSLPNILEYDPGGSTIEAQFKVKRGIVYPVFNLDIPWNQMEPVLGMRYNDPEQLKLALCNYGVAHRYQLWFMKNDWKSLLVFCRKDIQEGRCAVKKGNKNRVLNKNRKKKANTRETSKKKASTRHFAMEDNFKPVVQPQRRLNPKVQDVVKTEIVKLLNAGLIYAIFDSPWVSLIHVVPKKNNKKITFHYLSSIRCSKDYQEMKYYCFAGTGSRIFSNVFSPRRPGENTSFTWPIRGLLHIVIIAPDWNLDFELMCDASDYVVRAILGQRIDKKFRMIYYASKTMNDAQEHYTTIEKELLPVEYAFR